MRGGKSADYRHASGSVDVLARPWYCGEPCASDSLDNLRAAGVALRPSNNCNAEQLTGKPQPIEFTDGWWLVRYRDGSVIDVIRRVKG